MILTWFHDEFRSLVRLRSNCGEEGCCYLSFKTYIIYFVYKYSFQYDISNVICKYFGKIKINESMWFKNWKSNISN